MFRSCPPEGFSWKMLCQHKANPQEHNHPEVRSQQSCFATLLKSHLRTDATPKIHSTHAEYPPPGEHLWGLLLYVKRVLKDLNIKSYYLHLLKEIFSYKKQQRQQ